MSLADARDKLQFVVKSLKALVIVLIAVVLVIGLALFFIGFFRPKAAGILVETIPEALVFIDGVQVGRTPHTETREPGEVVIKLVPESFDKPLVPYETKVNLVSGVETVISWEFGESDEEAAGEIASFERVGRDETSLSIVSIPDSAQVEIDSAIKVFAPYKTSTFTPGEHEVVASAEGYLQRSIKVRTEKGYKLTVVVKLAPSQEMPEEEIVEEKQVEKEEERVEVEILSTPTGFLRVRKEPSTLSEEIERVKPGERYLFLGEDEKTGWFKIEYEEGKEGWVSNTYSEKIGGDETKASPTTSPSPTVTPTEIPTATPE